MLVVLLHVLAPQAMQQPALGFAHAVFASLCSGQGQKPAEACWLDPVLPTTWAQAQLGSLLYFCQQIAQLSSLGRRT